MTGHRLTCCGLLALLLALSSSGVKAASFPPEVTDSIRASVGRVVVRAPNSDQESVGAAFLYKDKDTVVTCLHVVAGASSIDIAFPSGARKATVLRVLRASDLALLKLDRPVDARPLRISASVPEAGAQLEAFGFAQGMTVLRSKTARRPVAGARFLREVVVKDDMRDAIRALGYPSLSAEILDLESSLEPGMSGGPLVNLAGEIVGVGNGGLDKGATEITWATPAGKLTALLASDDEPPSGPAMSSNGPLFSATTHRAPASKAATIRIAQTSFVLTKSRTLAELEQFADDKLGLHQLKMAFAMFAPEKWLFDVYRSPSGATVVVPAGLTLKANGADAIGLDSGGMLSFRIRLSRHSDPYSLQLASAQFESEQLTPAVYSVWTFDPQWSYPMVLSSPNGLNVRRKASIRGVPYVNYGQPVMGPVGNILLQSNNGYNFVAFASYRNELLSVAAHREELVIPPGFNLRQHQESWGRMALAVQLSTFALGDHSGSQ